MPDIESRRPAPKGEYPMNEKTISGSYVAEATEKFASLTIAPEAALSAPAGKCLTLTVDISIYVLIWELLVAKCPFKILILAFGFFFERKSSNLSSIAILLRYSFITRTNQSTGIIVLELFAPIVLFIIIAYIVKKMNQYCSYWFTFSYVLFTHLHANHL